MNDPNLSSFIWSVADLLRGDYKQSEYGKVILPFTVLRRLDCVLEATKPAVLKELEKREAAKINPEPFLLKKAGQLFYNTSPLDMKRLMGDQDHIGENLRAYMQAFSPAVRDIFESFDFHTQIDRLAKAKLLYLVTEKFANIDLHPDVVSNAQMGAVFEELIRKFAELSNETAGEHFTPREVIRLMVNLLFIEDDDALTKPGIVRSMYDPTAGTGGMLSVSDEHLASMNGNARLVMYGQELNPESYAICKADMLIKGQDIANIIFGNTLSADGLPGKHFDYMLSNPPFGVEWKKIQKEIEKEHEQQGYNGRFGPGLPRVSDGSLLFLMHLVSKMRPAKDGGSRFGIVLNGSPLFTGGAGSGESEIRRYMLENDLVEAIIGLPTDMFYNTGISTYIWIVSNRKPKHREGKLQLIDASGFWQKMRKSLGSKRKELSTEHIEEITQLFGKCKEAKQDGAPISRIFKNTEFGYRTITVERPLRDEAGKIVIGTKGKGKGKPVPDTSLRDTENVPLSEDVDAYFQREVLPHAADAWIDEEKTKVGYEIPFNRHFYVFKPPRPLAEIDAELKGVTDRILTMIGGLTKVSFPQYPKYKDSGVEWLGDVPEHWDVKRLKHSLRLLTEKTGRRENPIGLENIESWSGRFISTESEFEGEGIEFEAGDILFGKLRPYLAKVYLAESSGEAVGDFHVMRPESGVHARFAQYQMLNGDFIAMVDGSTFGSKMPRANWEFVGGMPIGTPPHYEQTAIAAFLDRETAKIDALVNEQRRLIELLKEKRQAVISHAVTKGLNPHAPMKPSGIEWIGNVPEHWEVGAVKRFFKVRNGQRIPLSTEERSGRQGEYPYYGASGVIDHVDEFIFDEPLVLVSEDGANLINRSTQIAFVARGQYWVNNHAHILQAIDDNHEFWAERIESIDLYPFVTGSAQPKLTAEAVGNLIIAVPPTASERKAIQEYFQIAAAEFDTLTAEAESAIDLLQERRTALISAAVTGKIDVRGLAESEAA